MKSPVLNTLFRLGFGRVTARMARRARYRLLYPLTASMLFPCGPLSGITAADASPLIGAGRAPGNSEVVSQEGDDLCRGRFRFLNLPPVDFGGRVDWNFAPDRDPLWLYNLHYGEWAGTLSASFLLTGRQRYRDAAIGLVSDWIEHNPVCKGPGWEPYPTARRLVAWSRLDFSFPGDSAWQGFRRDRLAPSLRQQARVLADNLEYDLSNNHLIADFRALAWAGLLFPQWPEAGKWRSFGLGGLREEMRRQVLPDGVHDERSISYHTIVLQDLLETWHLCRLSGLPAPEDVEPVLGKMMQFLSDMQAPDGSYPMFNDSVGGYPIDFRSVLLAGGLLFGNPRWVSLAAGADASYAAGFSTGAGGDLQRQADPLRNSHLSSRGRPGGGDALSSYGDAGYVVMRDDNGGCLYFDSGPMGPAHLPGHGHADALSFVLYGKGMPLIVDPGVYSYHDGRWRDHFRSTAAHNTVSIDGQDQCRFWGKFRVAYPPKVRLLECSEGRVSGEHDGYARLNRPVIHRRCIERKGPGTWEILDRFEGKGEHDFNLTLQFSRGAEVRKTGRETSVVRPEGTGIAVDQVAPPRGAVTVIENGLVSPGWNIKETAPRFSLKWRGRVPLENRILLRIL